MHRYSYNQGTKVLPTTNYIPALKLAPNDLNYHSVPHLLSASREVEKLISRAAFFAMPSILSRISVLPAGPISQHPAISPPRSATAPRIKEGRGDGKKEGGRTTTATPRSNGPKINRVPGRFYGALTSDIQSIIMTATYLQINNSQQIFR